MLRLPPRLARFTVAGGAFLVLVVTGFTLLLALAGKAPCLGAWPAGKQPAVCYNDVQTLWHGRELGDHAMPYVDGGVQVLAIDGEVLGAHFTGHELEYPVLTGVFVYLTALPATGHTSFLLFTAAALVPVALMSAWLLERLVGRRALLFAAAPPLVWYAFLNWDLLVVAATVAALYAWRRDRMVWAGVWLGVGASLKLWPAFLLAPLALDLWLRHRRRAAVCATVAGTAAALAPNLPFMLINFRGWMAPFTFQSYRKVDLSTNSVWFWAMPFGNLNTINVMSWTAVAFAFAGILGYRLWRAYRYGEPFGFVQASAAMTVAFILLGKVHSPQYALWVLPFLVLLDVPLGWCVAFFVADVWLYAQWSWMPSTGLPMFSAVFGGDAILAALAAVTLRVPLAVRERRGPVPAVSPAELADAAA